MQNKSFTLIELTIVILVISILVAIALRSIGSQNIQARDIKRVGDLRNMSTYLAQYMSKMDQFPTSTDISALEIELQAKGVIVAKLPVAPAAGGAYSYYACSDSGSAPPAGIANHYILVAPLEQDPTKNVQIYQASWDGGTSSQPNGWQCNPTPTANVCNKTLQKFCVAE